MKRPIHIWLTVVLCVATLTVALGWVTYKVLQLESQAAAARQRSAAEEARARVMVEFDQNVRVALWQMDSVVSPIIALESSRDYLEYRSVHSPSRPLTPLLELIDPKLVLLESPLLRETPYYAVVHFETDSGGAMRSPQVPETPSLREQVTDVRQYRTPEEVAQAEAELAALSERIHWDELLAALPPERDGHTQLAGIGYGNDNEWRYNELVQREGYRGVTRGKGKAVYEQRTLDAAQTRQATVESIKQEIANNTVNGTISDQQGDVSFMRGEDTEFWPDGDAQNRPSPPQTMNNPPRSNAGDSQAQGGQQGQQQAEQQSEQMPGPQQAAQPQAYGYSPYDEPMPTVRQGVMTPLWLGDRLVLARRVSVNGKLLIQGCVLNWPVVHKRLIGQVKHLLPQASLTPLYDGGGSNDPLALATIHARLDPGPVPQVSAAAVDGAANGWWSPMKLGLMAAWVGVAIAIAAVVLLLRGAVALSERRGAFVSSVTHELRTPLTTFRMYTEMLTGGMVRDKSQASLYLNTLSGEAERLSHLVENVLSYSRIERGRASKRVETVTVGRLLDRMTERLARRAGQADLALDVRLPDEVAAREVTTDLTAVEQILFNLVDNATKYASDTDDRRVHLEASGENGKLRLAVRDHGPGIRASEARRLFRPFHKSAHDAASTAPGVGLGLALSRRLAQQLGGELRLDHAVSDGARFELTLPMANGRA